MRTTIRIDDALYREVKERAARSGRTVAAVLALLPVHRGAFIIGLGFLFVCGLLAEIAIVFSRSSGTSQPPADA